MLFQDNETEDDDEWNPCKAAGVSLMLLATCCEDDIVPHVLPFVTHNITLAEWNKRDAAIMAFGNYDPFTTTHKPSCRFSVAVKGQALFEKNSI